MELTWNEAGSNEKNSFDVVNYFLCYCSLACYISLGGGGSSSPKSAATKMAFGFFGMTFSACHMAVSISDVLRAEGWGGC